MQISTDELREAADKLFSHLDEMGKHTLTINQDYYWAIPPSQRYAPYNHPTEFTLGQLSDDLAEVKKIVGGESSPIGYGLVWLAAILRAIGEESVA